MLIWGQTEIVLAREGLVDPELEGMQALGQGSDPQQWDPKAETSCPDITSR